MLSLPLQSRQHDMFLEYQQLNSRIHRAKPLLLLLLRDCEVWWFFLQALNQSFLIYFCHEILVLF